MEVDGLHRVPDSVPVSLREMFAHVDHLDFIGCSARLLTMSATASLFLTSDYNSSRTFSYWVILTDILSNA